MLFPHERSTRTRNILQQCSPPRLSGDVPESDGPGDRVVAVHDGKHATKKLLRVDDLAQMVAG